MTTRISASPVGHARHAFGRPRRATRAAAAAHPRWRATTVASAREEFSSSSRSPSRRTALASSTEFESSSPRPVFGEGLRTGVSGASRDARSLAMSPEVAFLNPPMTFRDLRSLPPPSLDFLVTSPLSMLALTLATWPGAPWVLCGDMTSSGTAPVSTSGEALSSGIATGVVSAGERVVMVALDGSLSRGPPVSGVPAMSTQSISSASEAAQLQLNVFEPIIIYNLLNNMNLMERGLKTLRTKCIDGITANPERCKELVDNSIGIVTALLPLLGYKKATAVAKEALETGRPVAEIASRFADPREVAEMLRPEAMTHPRRLVDVNTETLARHSRASA